MDKVQIVEVIVRSPIQTIEVHLPAQVQIVEVVVPAPVAIAEIAIPGIQGPEGPTGPPGGQGHLHTQASPASTWTIAHNLGRYPSVTLYSVGGSLMLGSVLNLSTNIVLIEFDGPYAGSAILF